MAGPRYDEPFHWWGPGWNRPPSRGLADLLRDGTLDVETGAVLWAALARRNSLAVAAGPSGAGKTTLLTALLDLVPAGTRRLYLRGGFESFSFLADPSLVPSGAVLLVNEISPHLPIYLWGPAVARVLATTERGFQILATAHADSVAEFVGLLTGSPLRITAPLVAAFEFVVFLEMSSIAPGGRRVRDMCRLTPTAAGVAFESLAPPPLDGGDQSPPASRPAQPRWFPERELIERRRMLDELRDGRIPTLPK